MRIWIFKSLFSLSPHSFTNFLSLYFSSFVSNRREGREKLHQAIIGKHNSFYYFIYPFLCLFYHNFVELLSLSNYNSDYLDSFSITKSFSISTTLLLIIFMDSNYNHLNICRELSVKNLIPYIDSATSN